jgi:hypothetical protein
MDKEYSRFSSLILKLHNFLFNMDISKGLNMITFFREVALDKATYAYSWSIFPVGGFNKSTITNLFKFKI